MLHDFHHGFLWASHFHLTGIFAAISVGLTLFLMAITNLEHPPGAGMALVLVLEMRNYDEIVVILFAAMILAFLHCFLRRRLIDLW